MAERFKNAPALVGTTETQVTVAWPDKTHVITSCFAANLTDAEVKITVSWWDYDRDGDAVRHILCKEKAIPANESINLFGDAKIVLEQRDKMYAISTAADSVSLSFSYLQIDDPAGSSPAA